MSDEIDWTAVPKPGVPGHAEISGGRHTAAPQVRALWNCPRCGEENHGPLEAGCAVCGSGQPGKHVGADPRAIPASERALMAEPPPREHVRSVRPTENRENAVRLGTEGPAQGGEYLGSEAATERAFDAWMLAMREERGIHAPDLLDAFQAGVAWALGRMVQPAPQGVPVPFEGTKETRTVIAALNFFIEHILVNTPEEVLNGEWCSIEEAQALIAHFERRG